MRKYKQVKEKKVIYSLDEWAIIEQRAADLAMKTGTYITVKRRFHFPKRTFLAFHYDRITVRALIANGLAYFMPPVRTTETAAAA